jgi:PAS domain S-box-containing protein
VAGRDFGVLFDRIPCAMMVLDRALHFVAANPAYLRTTGSTLEQLVGNYVFDVFPDSPTDHNVALLKASFERVLATRALDEVAAITYRVARVPGGPLEERVWSARHIPLLDDSGEVELIVQETEEVARRETTAFESPRLVDRAIRAGSELRDLRQMFAQAPGFMCFTRGREHVFEIVNDAYLQLVGHRNVIGRSVATALPEIVDQGFIQLLDGVFTTGEPFIGKDLRAQLQVTPGAPLVDRYLDFIYQPIRDDANEVVGIFVQGQDVTARHHAATATIRAEAELRFLIELLPVQVWTSDPHGQLDFVSQRVVSYFQQPVAEILGNGWLAVLHPDDVAACVERWTHSLTTGASYEVEFRLRRGDGEYRWHLGRADAHRGPDGAVLRWFGTNTDVHDAKLALAELRARSEYEQRLIGIVSHDLRNPLNAVALGTQLLATQRLDDKSVKIVARITRAADRAMRLITDLLDFASARIGTTIPINPRPTNLREIVEQVVDELQMTSARHIRIGHAGHEDGRWDADRIAQVLSNLVGNALQHAPPDAAIQIESRIDGDNAMFEVINAGPPIPSAELPGLFEPFKRGQGAGAASGSMGLGLYIAREVVAAHGGTIEVASDLIATRFTVRLPRFVAARA